LAAPNALVWLHDHHLQLVPSLLRDLRPDVRIGVTMHSPFPPAESFLALAEREDIMTSLSGADLVAFQESRSAANFQSLADELQLTLAEGRQAKAVMMPMPAETGTMAHLAKETKVQIAADRIRASLRPATTVFLSMGGNDPADGSAQALQEFAKLLSAKKLDPRRVAYIHLAPTSNFPGAASQAPRQELERLVAKVNGEFASPGHCPVHYQRRDITAAELTALYLAADVMLAAPLRDRATPQAAEYAAAHTDGRGQIIISEFSSTIHQLGHSKAINPHEPSVLSEAIVAAAQNAKRRSAAMLAMHQRAVSGGVSLWAKDFLTLLAGNTVPQNSRRRIQSIVEGSTDSAQPSDFGSQLTATASHP
jgi:trehalose 6-phosphate synthase